MADEMHLPQASGKAPRPNTKEEKMALAKRAIDAKENHGVSYEDFQRSLNMDIGKATLNYWISEYKKSQKPKFPVPPVIQRTALAKIPLEVQQEGEIKDLQNQVKELIEQLREAKATIKAQNNVIIILGHQHSKDD